MRAHRIVMTAANPILEFTMKKLLIILVGSFTLAAALPTYAGADWLLIEKARKNKQTASETARVSSSRTAGARGDCPVEPLVLPIDHGPRAQTTPYQNQLRRARHEAQLKACERETK